MLHACVKVGIAGGDADVPPIPGTAWLVKISRERPWANHGLWGKAASRFKSQASLTVLWAWASTAFSESPPGL